MEEKIFGHQSGTTQHIFGRTKHSKDVFSGAKSDIHNSHRCYSYVCIFHFFTAVLSFLFLGTIAVDKRHKPQQHVQVMNLK